MDPNDNKKAQESHDAQNQASAGDTSASFVENPPDDRSFRGTINLVGELAFRNFQESTVVLAGVGGVGSWVAEALARNGVGRIVLIDLDHVAESNINRQIMADRETLGEAKIEAMRSRIQRINPLCEVEVVDDFISSENMAEILGRELWRSLSPFPIFIPFHGELKTLSPTRRKEKIGKAMGMNTTGFSMLFHKDPSVKEFLMDGKTRDGKRSARALAWNRRLKILLAIMEGAAASQNHGYGVENVGKGKKANDATFDPLQMDEEEFKRLVDLPALAMVFPDEPGKYKDDGERAKAVEKLEKQLRLFDKAAKLAKPLDMVNYNKLIGQMELWRQELPPRNWVMEDLSPFVGGLAKWLGQEAAIPAWNTQGLFVIDATDGANAKSALAAFCLTWGIPFAMSGAGGGKDEPTLVRSGDITSATNDKMLASQRTNLRKLGLLGDETQKRRPVASVWCEMTAQKRDDMSCQAQGSLSCAGYGSSMLVTATMGFALADLALRHLAMETECFSWLKNRV